MLRGGVEGGAGTAAGRTSDLLEVRGSSSESGYSASPPINSPSIKREELVGPKRRDLSPGAAGRDKRRKEKAPKKRKKVRALEDAPHAGDLNVQRALEDSKGTSTRDLQSQLLRTAAENTRRKKEKEKQEKKRQEKKDPGLQLVKILTRAVQPQGERRRSSSQKRDQDKKKEKKKKDKRMRQGGDPSSSPSSSQDGSGSSRSLRARKGEKESSSSSSDDEDDRSIEAPVQEETWQRSDHVAGACKSSARPTLQGGYLDRGGPGHFNRSEDELILCHRGQADAGELHGPDPGASPHLSVHRLTPPRRFGFARRCLGRKIHLPAPKRAGWRMEHGKAPGAPPSRRRLGSQPGGSVTGAAACEAGGQGSTGNLLELGRRWSRACRERSRKLVGAIPRLKRQRQEGSQRKRKGQELGPCARERKRCKNQGEGAREVVEDTLPSFAPASAVGGTSCETGLFGSPPVVPLKDVIALCTSYRRIGCVLAWLLITDAAHLVSEAAAMEFTSLWKAKIAKNKPARALHKGAVFPIREGELKHLVQAFRQLALTDLVREPTLVEWSDKAWVYLAICSLNRLAGLGGVPSPGRWSKLERTAVDSLERAAKRRSDQDLAVPTSEELWRKELESRRIGYGGEEVSICHKLTWDQILPGLPPAEHGGCVDALLWVGSRTRYFLLNPELLLKDPEKVVLPRMPGKIHMDPKDKLRIAFELVRRQVCDWIPLDKVHKVDGVPILNGLFGVSKPTSLDDGRPILRFIMNLTGSNSTQHQLEGGSSSLPAITSWQSIVVDEDEQIVVHQSDMSSAFYLFRLPPCWRQHLAFNILADGSEVNGEPGTTYALCCCVIPMGWLNSVSIMQEISENLLNASKLPQRNQISRGRILPPWMSEILDTASAENKSWWHIYLDNYAGAERITPGETAEGASICHAAAEAAWMEAGVVSSLKKRVTGSSLATELGAEINGDLATLGLSTEKLVKLIQSTLWMISQPRLGRKLVQIVAGRWIFALQFRRPSMSFLQNTWRFVNGHGPASQQLRQEVKREFLGLVYTAFLHHCFLGASVSPSIVCTDASERGGSVEYANSLEAEGSDFLQASTALESSRATLHCPILVISLFNGIGGCFRCYDIIGVTPAGRIAVDIDDAGNRVTQRRWPGTLLVKDVKTIDAAMVHSWSLKYLNVTEVHLWGGWPCVGLSAVRYGRQNLDGPQSSLFWEIPRIKDLLEKEFGATAVIKYVLENVASMDQHAAQQISHELGVEPYRLDCADAVPMRRPRYAWTSEDLTGVFSDVSITQRRYWWDVTASATYPRTEQWPTPGYAWDGEQDGCIFPTCMKSIPRTSPPIRPAGLEKCDSATRDRWAQDQFRYPPYQYQRQYIITSSTTWRLLNATEKELLLGYGFNHTILAWSASRSKQNPTGFSDAQHKLLGDSFSIYSFVILAATCCRAFLPVLSYQHLAQRMGIAPGFVAAFRSSCPLSRSLKYGSSGLAANDFQIGVELLNRFLLRKANHTGSDIRVLSGEIMNNRAFPRQSVSSTWWQWNHAFSTRWKKKSHINVLELETILLGIKFQISRLHAVDQRIFQLTDSYICLSVASKGRTSSQQLTRVLNVISAHLLAFGLHLIMGHIDSAENPADDGSRN